MILVIDVGNTQIKAAVFEQDTMKLKEVIAYSGWQNAIKIILNNFRKIQNIAVASVGKLMKEDFLNLNCNVKITFITKNFNFPFHNLYETPATLGIDRMVLATGATLMFPERNRLVIDVGTCITYDYIDANNNYLGGAISPGIRLRYQSLHNYTAKLPLLTVEDPETMIGQSTIKSIHSGVVNGVVNEINGFIEVFRAKNENFIIILTGGDTEFLAKRLKNTIFANPNFLLESLNQTFQFNQND